MIYQVEWRIDVEADSAEEAAIKARAAQVRPDTTAVVFEVFHENHYCDTIDLNDESRGLNPGE
jgi:hypothetical protein